MKEGIKRVTEKTGLQGAAMICFIAGIQFMASIETTENKLIGVGLILFGLGSMLYKYKREADRGVPQ